MKNVSGKRIVLGVCGGIAAYKVVELARELTQSGSDVQVVMTPSATKFVGEVTFSTLTGNPVATQLFPDPAPPDILHTTMARRADIIVIAPATAKIIAKYALGISDDLMSSLLLASKCPVVICPAMHTEMWENEATATNVATLRSRGVRFAGPEEGPLAGPDVGIGRLAGSETILTAIDDELRRRESLSGLRVLVTAGGTQEPIDPVRVITNRSSGRMGFEVAEEALRRGAKVTLVAAPSSLTPPSGAEVISVVTAAQMREAVLQAAENASVVVMAAAVADWRPRAGASSKLKKAAGAPNIDLEPTGDILAELGREKGERILVGFSAETEDLEENGRKKLAEKGADLIVANLVGVDYSGFDVETNLAVLIDRHGLVEELPLMSKRELSGKILDAVAERFL